MDSLYELKTNLGQSSIFLCFSGPFTQELMVELGEILKQKMKLAEADTSTILKVFSVLIEQSQNILHHSAAEIYKSETPARILSTGIIAVGQTDDNYFVIGGNKIQNRDVEKLQEKLSKIKNMDQSELKDYYKKMRKIDPQPGDKGAGLGLIEVARKASKPIEFQFSPIDSEYTFYSLKTII